MNAANTDPLALLLEMRHLTVSALRDPTVAVVEGVNWAIAPGDFWVIGGLQGAGKSDFLMVAAGLMPPLAGECRLGGEAMPIFEDSRLAQRLRLGLVFEGGQLLNHLTVLENVALPLRYHRNLTPEEAEDRAHAMLSATGLLPWAANTPGAISHPWRKRAGLARALMLHPELLLVDNPLSGSDPRHTQWWLDFLAALARGHPLLDGQPVTLVVSVEDFRPWRTRATRFALLADRRFTVLGNWEEVEHNPAPAVQALLGEPKLADAAKSSPGGRG